MPKIIVGMPVYNNATYLSKAIESILQQTYKDFQLLVVDDGSTDNSVGIVQSYCDPRIRLLKHERNLGRPYARNTVLRYADAKYLAWMDADDISLPQRLEKQVDYLDNNADIAICASQLQYFNNAVGKSKYSNNDAEICAGMIFSPTIPNACSCIRLDAIRTLGLSYKSNLVRAQDYGFWVDAVLFGRLRANILPEILYLYRFFDNPTTSYYHKEVLRNILKRLQVTYTENSLNAYNAFALYDTASLSTYGLTCFLDLIAELYAKLEMQNLVDLPTLKNLTNARLACFFDSKHVSFKNFIQYCTWRHTEAKICLKLFSRYCVNALLPYGSKRRELVKKFCGRGNRSYKHIKSYKNR